MGPLQHSNYMTIVDTEIRKYFIVSQSSSVFKELLYDFFPPLPILVGWYGSSFPMVKHT